MTILENPVDSSTPKDALEHDALRDVITLSLWAGQMMLQNGADSQRVEETVHHLGTGLGCDWLDILVMPHAIMVTTTSNQEFRTRIRRAPGRGVNMSLIAAISDLSYQVNQGDVDRCQLRDALREIDTMPRNYNRWQVVFAVGLSCAAFSRLFGGDIAVLIIVLLASSLAMFVRQELHHRYFNGLLITVITAAVAGFVASFASLLNLTAQSETALAASVLLLVPGVPLINAAEDLINGHIVTGLARGFLGLLFALSIATGLSIVFWITGGGGL
ncbi:MAG: threonine/serine exporter family protein [Aggregatilineales bacterium]